MFTYTILAGDQQDRFDTLGEALYNCLEFDHYNDTFSIYPEIEAIIKYDPDTETLQLVKTYGDLEEYARESTNALHADKEHKRIERMAVQS